MKTYYALTAAAVLLVAVYIATVVTQPPFSTATSTQPQQTSTAPLHTTQQPTQQTTTAQQKPETSSATQTPTATSTQQPQTPTQPTKLVPHIEAEVAAPAEINTTAMPTALNYTIVIRNTGNGTGYVEVEGRVLKIEPGQKIEIKKSKSITSAGTYTIEERVGNTTVAKTVRVYYYTPRLEAEDVVLNVTDLPTVAEVNITVVNRGNLTGRIDGLEIPPGAKATVAKRVNITAAGLYYLEVGGLKAKVVVRYLKAAVEIEVPQTVYEIVPGEQITVRVVVKNTGNHTAEVEGAAVKPGETITLNYTLRPDRAGVYSVKIKAGGSEYKYDVEVRTIAYWVKINVLSPFSGGFTLPDRRSFELKGDSAQIKWRPSVYTNATYRTITLIVDGKAVRVPPRSEVDLEERTTTAKVPSTTTLSLYVNGTEYTLVLELKAIPPTLTVSGVTSIWFRDTRSVPSISIYCTRPIQHSENFDLQSIEATIDFDRGELSGVAYVFWGTSRRIDFRGTLGSNQGVLTVDLSNTPAASLLNPPVIIVEFTTEPSVKRVTTASGTELACTYPVQLIPKVLKKPEGSMRIDYFALSLVNAFAKTSNDVASKVVEVEGTRVVVEDGRGNQIEVSIGNGYVEIKTVKSIYGALEAKIYATTVIS